MNQAENAELYAKLQPIFRDVFDEDGLTVGPETTAHDVEGWDSLAHIRLVVSVEKAFRIAFSSAEIGELKNVGQFVSLIRAKM